MQNKILITGGAGFIGSNFVHHWLAHETSRVLNLDLLTYAGNLQNLEGLPAQSRHEFVQGDIADADLIARLLRKHQPSAVVHLAAESHVDRSIHAPEAFIRTNVLGTFQLLHAAREYWQSLVSADRERFRFLHVSTDEVYGSLGASDPAFCEITPYAPNSPYSASKAGSDHLVRVYYHTYGLPTLITNCSNNYGPRQFPEKLIPLMIMNALAHKPLPIYGDGLNVRDWIYVEDHCVAIRTVLHCGGPGETYNVGGKNEKTNLDVVNTICSVMGELRPGFDYQSLITHVKDRAGHDRRYSMNCEKIATLKWHPRESFETGIRKTVLWYLDNMERVLNVTSSATGSGLQ